jgi:multidrug resistance efflux pump
LNRDLFRPKALSKFLRPDAPGALLAIAPPATVAVFALLAASLIALTVVGVRGEAQMAVTGRGVVAPDQPPLVVRAPGPGRVLSVDGMVRERGEAGAMLVTLDARVEAAALEKCSADLAEARRGLEGAESRVARWTGDDAPGRDAAMALVVLAQVRNDRERVTAMAQRCDSLRSTVERSRVVFPLAATVLDVAVGPGAQVHEGDVLATLLPSTAKLVGYLSFGAAHRAELAPGQKVVLAFDAIPRDELGAGEARLAHVLDAAPSWVKLDSEGAVAEVSIDAMPRGSGPPRPGMTFSASVLTRRVPLLALLGGSAAP